MRDLAYKSIQARERLTGTLKREPTIEEVCKEVGAEKYEVVTAMESICEPISLYEPVYSENGDTLYVIDQLSDHGTANDWIDNISIKEAVNGLSQREKNILELRFYQGKTQIEVAKEIGISQAQVSRLEKNAVNKIKSAV
jgi:RNA polymerase sporulation-specific sigma factor